MTTFISIIGVALSTMGGFLLTKQSSEPQISKNIVILEFTSRYYQVNQPSKLRNNFGLTLYIVGSIFLILAELFNLVTSY